MAEARGHSLRWWSDRLLWALAALLDDHPQADRQQLLSMLDDQGVWQATAIKDGKSMPVAMDFQGNVVSK